MKWLRAVNEWWNSKSSATRHAYTVLVMLVLTAAGVPPEIRNVAQVAVSIVAGTPAPVIAPPVPVQIGTAPDILQGIVPPSPPETSSRDTQGPPEGGAQ